MKEFIVVFLGIAAGAAGFLISNFWFQPVLWYRAIRNQVISDLVFYANAINAKGLNDAMKARLEDRIIANRRHSADLVANHVDLPGLYRWYLLRRGERPDGAAVELMGLSNTTEYEEANRRIKKIQEYLRIKPRVV